MKQQVLRHPERHHELKSWSSRATEAKRRELGDLHFPTQARKGVPHSWRSFIAPWVGNRPPQPPRSSRVTEAKRRKSRDLHSARRATRLDQKHCDALHRRSLRCDVRKSVALHPRRNPAPKPKKTPSSKPCSANSIAAWPPFSSPASKSPSSSSTASLKSATSRPAPRSAPARGTGQPLAHRSRHRPRRRLQNRQLHCARRRRIRARRARRRSHRAPLHPLERHRSGLQGRPRRLRAKAGGAQTGANAAASRRLQPRKAHHLSCHSAQARR